MKIGVQAGMSDCHSREFIKDAFAMIEEMGFDSIWTGEHVLLFSEYDSPYPYSPDGKLKVTTKGVMDSFTLLSFAAAVTSKVRLGTAVSLLPQRNAVYAAKQAADLDALSGGRFDFGVGFGWLKEEYDSVGEDWATRGKRMNEVVQAMRALWNEDVTNFSGDFYDIKNAWLYPKPIQKNGPPILFGGESKPMMRRIAQLGDGWLAAAISPEVVSANMDVLKGFMDAESRPMEDLNLKIMGAFNKENAQTYKNMGFNELVAPLPMSSYTTIPQLREAIKPLLDLKD